MNKRKGEDMRRRRALLGIMLGVGAPCLATQMPTAPSALLDPADPPDVVRTGPDLDERVTIPISIDGKGPWNFVIDTGSQRTVIARDLARELALPERATVTIISMTGRSETRTVAVPKLRFGSGTIDDIEAPVLEGKHLGADGLLGLDSLHAKRVTLNFKTGRMEIGRSSSRRRAAEPGTIVVEARRKRGQLILLDSEVNGMRVAIMLDTGTRYSIGNMALRDKLLAKKRAPDMMTTTLTSVTGGTMTGELGRIRSVRMGRVNLTQVPVVFADASPFAELGMADKPALLLGISALRGFDRVAIDFGRGRVDFLLPDASALDKTRFASSDAPAG
jgi:predicted aspartyl protease